MKRRAFLALFAVLAAGGCSTMADPSSDRGEGVLFSYAAPFEQVWAALPEILRELGMRITKQDAKAGYLLAEEGGGFGTGVSTLVFVERLGSRGHSRVEVVSKGTLGVNLTGISDGAKSIHERLAQRFRRL